MSRIAHFERGDEVIVHCGHTNHKEWYTGIVIKEYANDRFFPAVSVDIGLKRLNGVGVVFDRREVKKTGRRFTAVLKEDESDG